VGRHAGRLAAHVVSAQRVAGVNPDPDDVALLLNTEASATR
jgi:predicted RNA methylase